MGNLRFYSEQKSWASARDVDFFDFIPREGPNGGRVVIDGFWVYATGQADYGTAATEGEDVARYFGRITVEQRDQVKRWSLPGDASRIASYALCGPERYTENADVAAANNVAVDHAIYIPMTKPLVHTGEDFALPVDEFGKLTIQGMSSGDMDLGTATVSIDSLSYYIVADCHEELDLQFHCVDVVKMDEMTSLTEGVLSIGGKLHDLYFHARGASGGASLANFTNIRIEEPRGLLPTSTTAELLREYRWKRKAGKNLNATMGNDVRADPFANAKAVAALLSDERLSAWEGYIIDRLKVNMTNTVASLRAITRTAKPRSRETLNAIARAYGLRSVEQISVKTAKKSKRSLGDWPAHLRPYLPLKAPLS